MNDPATRKNDLKTLTALAAVLLIFYLVFRKAPFIWAATGLLVLALFFKTAAAKFAASWLRLSAVLGKFNTKLVLSAIYYGFLTPTALLYKLAVKDPVNAPKDDSRSSYFRVREHTFSARDLENPW